MEKRICAAALFLCILGFTTLSVQGHFSLKINVRKIVSTTRPSIKEIERVVNESTRNEWHQREMRKLMTALRKKLEKKERIFTNRIRQRKFYMFNI